MVYGLQEVVGLVWQHVTNQKMHSCRKCVVPLKICLIKLHSLGRKEMNRNGVATQKNLILNKYIFQSLKNCNSSETVKVLQEEF